MWRFTKIVNCRGRAECFAFSGSDDIKRKQHTTHENEEFETIPDIAKAVETLGTEAGAQDEYLVVHSKHVPGWEPGTP